MTNSKNSRPVSNEQVSSDSLADIIKRLTPDDKGGRKLPPVHLWNPEHCGDIRIEIRKDGSWWHEGVRIGRERLVRLFSTILRKDEDGIYLVTPHEKVIVHVEDVPFLAVRVDRLGEVGPNQSLAFTTNVGDVTVASEEAPIRVEIDQDTFEPAPYVTVRAELDAKMTRPVFYELANMAIPNPEDGGITMGVWSRKNFFVIGKTP